MGWDTAYCLEVTSNGRNGGRGVIRCRELLGATRKLQKWGKGEGMSQLPCATKKWQKWVEGRGYRELVRAAKNWQK